MKSFIGTCTITIYTTKESIQTSQSIELQIDKEKFIDIEKLIRVTLASASNISIEKLISEVGMDNLLGEY